MRIVLVRPRDPNNIGAAARAMANFGLDDLVVVDPYPPVWREAKSAVGAGPVLAAAREVSTLAEAVAECSLVGATTAGTRRTLERIVDPGAFADEARGLENGARVALVFGNEKSGLSAADVEACHVAVRIGTTLAQPSMNLGQAVAVCAYEWTRARDVPSAARARERPATLEAVDVALAALYPTAFSPAVESRRRAARERLRALLLRGRATEADVALLRGLVMRRSTSSEP